MKFTENLRSKYDFVSCFKNGFARVRLIDKEGFVNKKGEEITPIKYDDVRDFENGFAEVELNGK